MPDAIETLTNAITAQEATLQASIPRRSREEVTLAMVHAQDHLLDGPDPTQPPTFDLIHGSQVANPGGSLALSLLLSHDTSEFHRSDVPSSLEAEHWANDFLKGCTDLADARQVLAHIASGFMRGEGIDDGSLSVWIAQKRFPPPWRERIDLAWWDAHSRRRTENEAKHAVDWQFGFLPDAIVADFPARIWTDAVRVLANRYRDANTLMPSSDTSNRPKDVLVERMGIGEAAAERIISALTLDQHNAAWQAAIPGIAAAPFVQVAPGIVAASRFGLQTQPLLFLARELRRRDAQNWHNAAHQREAAFRHDLAEAFADKRFVHAPTRIQLKRDGGTLRTDIDAAIFDRKTGTLALFELKSQDPFSRSLDELERRRDNVLAANRQLSGILDWIKRHKPDEVLDRIDHQTAKRFHVQRVLPFVLARTLVHFNDGPAPDRRVAWGTWPDVLRLVDAGSIAPTTANPLQTLFTRLQGWPGDPPIPPRTPPRTIHLSELTVAVAPSRQGER